MSLYLWQLWLPVKSGRLRQIENQRLVCHVFISRLCGFHNEDQYLWGRNSQNSLAYLSKLYEELPLEHRSQPHKVRKCHHLDNNHPYTQYIPNESPQFLEYILGCRDRILNLSTFQGDQWSQSFRKWWEQSTHSRQFWHHQRTRYSAIRSRP